MTNELGIDPHLSALPDAVIPFHQPVTGDSHVIEAEVVHEYGPYKADQVANYGILRMA